MNIVVDWIGLAACFGWGLNSPKFPPFSSGRVFLKRVAWLELCRFRLDEAIEGNGGLFSDSDSAGTLTTCYFRLNGLESVRSELASSLVNLFAYRSSSYMYAKKSWNTMRLYEVIVKCIVGGHKYRKLENINFGFGYFWIYKLGLVKAVMWVLLNLYFWGILGSLRAKTIS